MFQPEIGFFNFQIIMKIICKMCGEFKEHLAKEMCNKCYGEKWKLENKEENESIL